MMTRKDLADNVYKVLKSDFPEVKAGSLWEIIAKTDDDSLLRFFSEHEKNNSKKY